LQHLHQEPKPGKHDPRHLEKERKKQYRNNDDQPRELKQADEASEHAGDCAGRSQGRHERTGIEERMRHGGENAAGKIEQQIPRDPKPILDGRAEQP
jgi:hypothetical protein